MTIRRGIRRPRHFLPKINSTAKNDLQVVTSYEGKEKEKVKKCPRIITEEIILMMYLTLTKGVYTYLQESKCEGRLDLKKKKQNEIKMYL